MKYRLPYRENVEIPALRFRIPVQNGYTAKAVECLAKGPFLADFCWDAESEQYVCDRLSMKKTGTRLDDVAAMIHLVHAASWWAADNLPHDQWESIEREFEYDA